MHVFSRRDFYKLSAGIFATALLTAKAMADALVSPDSVNYQPMPYQGSQCSGCKNFVPGASAGADGTCKVVSGAVSPKGYCVAFSPA